MVLLEGKAKGKAVDSLKAASPKLFPDTRAYEGCRGVTAYSGRRGRAAAEPPGREANPRETTDATEGGDKNAAD